MTRARRSIAIAAAAVALLGCANDNVVGRMADPRPTGGAGGGTGDAAGTGGTGGAPADARDAATPPATRTIVLQPGPADSKDVMVPSTRAVVPGEPSFTAQAWTSGGTTYTSRGYIAFDMSAVPPAARVTRATLSLFADPNLTSHSGQNDWALYAVIEAWEQATVSWAAQPAVAATPIAEFPASATPYQDYVIDVTAFIVASVLAPAAYHGLMFRLLDETPYRRILFCTSEHPEIEVRPTLTVEYEVP